MLCAKARLGQKQTETDRRKRFRRWLLSAGRAHRDYQMGLLWTMANDPAMPAKVREGMKPWGLCKDEFTASEGWPPALYVRAARRLVGERIFTQGTPEEQDRAGDIGASWYENGHFAPFIHIESSFCQDRVGTNIGKTQVRFLTASDWGTTTSIRCEQRTVLFPQLFLCLSRACLGKMIVFN